MADLTIFRLCFPASMPLLRGDCWIWFDGVVHGPVRKRPLHRLSRAFGSSSVFWVSELRYTASSVVSIGIEGRMVFEGSLEAEYIF